MDVSDIPELSADFWQKAQWVEPPAKADVHMKLDQDVVDFFKQGGQGYQTRINAVLRAFVDAQRG
ncbi:MAG: BrnA antitoxin family protein [Rhodospirillales bacterium]